MRKHSNVYTNTYLNGIGGTTLSASSVAPTCYGGNDGSATVMVSGGQAPYSYTWYDNIGQPISTNVSASNLSAGNYIVTVTDASGCSGNSTVVLNNPAAISLTLSTTQTSCGGSSGTATVSGIANGTAPYAYAWTDGQTTSTATGL